jgi:hypothetical protein
MPGTGLWESPQAKYDFSHPLPLSAPNSRVGSVEVSTWSLAASRALDDCLGGDGVHGCSNGEARVSTLRHAEACMSLTVKAAVLTNFIGVRPCTVQNDHSSVGTPCSRFRAYMLGMVQA